MHRWKRLSTLTEDACRSGRHNRPLQPVISARETTLCSRRITSITAASSDLIELHRLFEFVRTVFRHRAYAFGCLDLPDRPVLYTVEGAIGVPVLDPQALRRQQRLTLSGVDPGLQRLVSCVQPLIRRIGFRVYALDDSGC